MRFLRYVMLLLPILALNACGNSDENSNVSDAVDEYYLNQGMDKHPELRDIATAFHNMGIRVSFGSDLGVVGKGAVQSAFKEIQAKQSKLLEELATAAKTNKISVYFGVFAQVEYFGDKYEMDIDAKFFRKEKEYTWMKDGVIQPRNYATFLTRQIRLLLAMIGNDTKGLVVSDKSPTRNPSQLFYVTSDSEFDAIIANIANIKAFAKKNGGLIELPGTDASIAQLRADHLLAPQNIATGEQPKRN